MPSSRLGSVALDNIAAFAPGTAPAEIQRLNRDRQVTVYASLLPGVGQTTVMDAMQASAERLNLGPDYRTRFAGRSRELARTGRAFMLAFGLSLVFMYLILAAQFESWLHPLTILLSLPLTLPFALVSIIIERAVAQHLLGAGPAGALRRREEERDPADRPGQPAPGPRDDACTRRSSRPAATGCGRS